MKFTKQLHIKNSIIVDEEFLESLEAFLKREYKSVEFEATCRDESTIETSHVNDIIQYRNLFNSRIIEIECNGRNDSENRTRIKIGSAIEFWPYLKIWHLEPQSANAEVICSSEDEGFLKTAKLKEIFATAHQWYSILTRINFNMIGLGIWLVTVGLLSFVRHFGQSGAIKSSCDGFTDCLQWFIEVNLIYLIGIAVLNSMKLFFFPRVFFCIGSQKKMHGIIQSLRNILFISVLLAGIIGLAVNHLSK